jgi:hypothetical protein
MHNMTIYSYKVILGKILLVVVGYFIVFNIYFFVREGFAFHDVLGVKGLWERPYYHVILNLLPYFYSHPYVRLLQSSKYWLKVILDLFLPIMAIVAFEGSRFRKKTVPVILFYLFIPAALYLLASIVVTRTFPSDS